MSQLPDSFPVPDWQLDPANYPAVFLIDKNWAETTVFDHEKRSLIADPLAGDTPLDTDNPRDHHGEKTRQVVCSVAKGLPNHQVTLVSLQRQNVIEDDNFSQHLNNLPEALMSVQAQLNTGDLVVVNLGTDRGQDSFSRDSLIAALLNDITNSLGGIVVIAAGNSSELLLSTLTPNAVVVGGVSTDGQPRSRFGEFITCYGGVPYNLPDLPPEYTRPVLFDRSSAATAYIGGMVLMMLNYARSKGLTPTGKQVVGLLKANSISFQLVSGSGTILGTGNIPDWNKLRPAIDVLANGSN